MIRLVFVAVAFLGISNSVVAESCLRSALIRGTAYNVRSCTYSIKFSYFADGILCPVTQHIAETLTVRDEKCMIAEGQEVEGVLQESLEGWTLED